MTTHIIYGSDSGRTRNVANKIAAKLGAKTIDVKTATVGDFEAPDLLILGTPTYGAGELQGDWESGVDVMRDANLAGKKVALFGLGDQESYSDTFADAIGTLYDQLIEQDAEVVGFTETTGYAFEESLAVRDGKFVGLVLDQDNQATKTDKRIASWISQFI